MAAVYLFQSYTCLSMLHRGHETPAFALGLETLASLLEVVIE